MTIIFRKLFEINSNIFRITRSMKKFVPICFKNRHNNLDKSLPCYKKIAPFSLHLNTYKMKNFYNTIRIRRFCIVTIKLLWWSFFINFLKLIQTYFESRDQWKNSFQSVSKIVTIISINPAHVKKIPATKKSFHFPCISNTRIKWKISIIQFV